MGLVIGSRASAGAFGHSLRSPVEPVETFGYPPDSERVPKVDRGERESAGQDRF